MKKLILIVMSIVIILILGSSIWMYFYKNHKSLDNIPSLELTMTYLQENGVEYTTDKLMGYTRDNMLEIWGEPDGMLFGFWGDVWYVDNDNTIILYYDQDGVVENVSMREK